MKKRKLGKGQLEVSSLGLGCMETSGGYGPAKDKAEMLSLIQKAASGRLSFQAKAIVRYHLVDEQHKFESIRSALNFI